MIKDRFGYRSPEIIFPNFFRNRSILSRAIAASNFNLEIRCSEWAFSNRTASRSFSLCIFSTLCAFHSDNRKIADILRIPQGSVLRASAFVAPRRKAGAAQIPVQTCRTIGFHCHKIQSQAFDNKKRSRISSRITRVDHLPTIRIIKKSSHSLSNE